MASRRQQPRQAEPAVQLDLMVVDEPQAASALTWPQVEAFLSRLALPSTPAEAWEEAQVLLHRYDLATQHGGVQPPWLLPKLAAAAAKGLQDSVARLSGPRAVLLAKLEGRRQLGRAALQEATGASLVVAELACRFAMVLQDSLKEDSAASFRPTQEQVLSLVQKTGE